MAHIGMQGEVTLIGSKRVDGSWRTTAIRGGGPCPIQVPLPAELHEVDWRVDPAQPLDESATTISLLATGQACSSGQPMGAGCASHKLCSRPTPCILCSSPINRAAIRSVPAIPKRRLSSIWASRLGADNSSMLELSRLPSVTTCPFRRAATSTRSCSLVKTLQTNQ